MAILFKDLYKAADGLLSGKAAPYTTNSEKSYSIKTKAGDITYSAEATQAGDKVKGKAKVAYKCSGGFTLKKLELNNSGKISFDSTFDKLVDNVRFILKGDVEPFKGSIPTPNFQAGAEYHHEDFKADLIVSSSMKADVSACFKKDAFLAGGSIKLNNEGYTGFNVGGGYSADGTTATLSVDDKLDVLATLHRKHTDDITFAASIQTSKNDADEVNAALEFGGSYIVDADTTVYSKLTAPSPSTKNLRATFHADHQLNANTNLSLTSVLNMDPDDVNNFFGSEFGLALKFGA